RWRAPVPIATRFPYTPLFRSGRGHDRVPHARDVDVDGRGEVLRRDRVPHLRDTDPRVGDHDVQPAEFGHPVLDDLLHAPEIPDRSEEHTSELQSRFDIVSRLL